MENSTLWTKFASHYLEPSYFSGPLRPPKLRVQRIEIHSHLLAITKVEA
jgi:hypothetical protein